MARDDAVAVGGCGDLDGPFRSGVGAVELGGRQYSVVYGQVPTGAVEVRVTLAAGAEVRIPAETGLYVHVWAGRADVATVEALDAGGQVIASVEVTPLSELERGLREQQLAG
jgi:hypothetical protein